MRAMVQEPTRGDPLHVDGTPTNVLTDESGRQPPQP
jgi:hypothetical protein